MWYIDKGEQKYVHTNKSEILWMFNVSKTLYLWSVMIFALSNIDINNTIKKFH